MLAFRQPAKFVRSNKMSMNSVEVPKGNQFNSRCKNAAALVALEVIPQDRSSAELFILLVRNKPESGRRRDTKLLMFPGGGIEGNEPVNDAAIRELKEETGLDVVGNQIKQTFNPNNPMSREYTKLLRQAPPLIRSHAFIDNNKVGVTLVFFKNINPQLAEFIMKQTRPADDVAEVHWVNIKNISIKKNTYSVEMQTPHGKIAHANAHCMGLFIVDLQPVPHWLRFMPKKFSKQNFILQQNGRVPLTLDQIPEREHSLSAPIVKNRPSMPGMISTDYLIT